MILRCGHYLQGNIISQSSTIHENQETKENIYNGITIQNIKISDFVCLNPNRLINNRCFCVQSILQIIKEALYITTGTQMYIQMHVCTHTHAQAHELFPKQN